LPRGRQERDLDAAAFQLAPLGRVVDRRVEQHRARRGEDACRRRRLQRESTITRSGWRAVGTSRTSSRGSSSSTVPTPVSRAPARLRQAWPSARAASPVIHWLTPLSSALRPVERDRGLEAQPGPAALHARDEADVELARLVFARADDDLDAGRGEARGALAGDERIRIAHRHHHPADAGGDERIGARRRAAVVRAGLEADDDGGAAHVGAAPAASRSAITSACGPPVSWCGRGRRCGRRDRR
jgi:hypothetical protein